MLENRLYSFGRTSRAQTPRAQTPRAQTPRAQTPRAQTPRDLSLLPQSWSRCTSLVSGRRGSAYSATRDNSPALRCRYCTQFLVAGEVAEHDRFCTLKPLACAQIDARTGTVCGYICRGKTMLADHEARCHAKQAVQQASTNERSSSSAMRERSYSNMIREARPRVCQYCATSFSCPAALARHKVCCPYAEVPCPLMCGRVFRRDAIPQHVVEQALEHKPMKIPSLVDRGADDPRVVMALVMNLLLEQVAAKGEKDVKVKPSNGATPRSWPVVQKMYSSLQENSLRSASRRSSQHSTSPKAVQVIMSPTPVTAKPSPSAAAPITRGGGDRHQTEKKSASPGQPPEPRSLIPEPTERNENSINSLNEPAVPSVGIREFSLPKKISSVLTSPHSEKVSSPRIYKKPPRVVNGKESSATPPRSTSVDEGVNDAFQAMNAQQAAIDQLREKYKTRDLMAMNEAEKQEIEAEIQRDLDHIEECNRKVHRQVMACVDRADANPANVVHMLQRWRSLDKNCYEMKLSLHDYVMSCHD